MSKGSLADWQPLEMLHPDCYNFMQVEQGRKQSWVSQQVPESVLWRVRELSVMHPYPRENRSKIYCTAPAVPSLPAPTSNLLAPLTTTF